MAKKPAAKPAAKPADLLANLTKKAGKAKPKPAANDNPVLEVHGVLAESVEVFTVGKQAAKVLDNAAEAVRDTVETEGLQRFIDLWVENGTKPANPRLKTPVASCILQVKQIKSPKDIDVEEALIQSGLSKEDAAHYAQFVEDTAVVATKNLYALMEGSDAEQKAAAKLLALIDKGLTDAEKELIFETKQVTVVDSEGVYAALAGKKKDTLDAVFSVLQPQLALGSLQHAAVLPVAQNLLAEAEEGEQHPNINVA